MGKKKENPRYNVLSVRLADTEYDRIQKVAKRDGLSISDYCRKVLMGVEL